jgi:hypothetical protein
MITGMRMEQPDKANPEDRWHAGRWIIIALGVAALVLILAVAIVSPVNPVIHPDEAFHVAAYRYYTVHLLPPTLDSPEVAATLSGYGYSYLFELDLVYAIAAWTTKPVAWLLEQPMMAARMFNVLLFAILVLAMAIRPAWAPALGIALVTPQAWYVFSYFNADALPLAIGLLLAAMASQPGGAVGRYLANGERFPWALLFFAALFALLILSKRNYLPLAAGLALALAIVHVRMGWVCLTAALSGLSLLCLSVFAHDIPAWTGTAYPLLLQITGAFCIALAGALMLLSAWRSRERWPVLRRLLILLAAAIAIAAPRVIWDMATNGTPSTRAETITRIMEERAVPAFKPSVVATGTGYEGRDIATRGVTLEQMLYEPYQWLHLSIGSAFGVYGYLNVFAPEGLYTALIAAFVVLAVLAMVGAVRNQGVTGAKLVLAMTVIALLIFAISILHSWTFDLQRQGRYLFPILPLVAILAGSGTSRAPRPALIVTLAVAAGLSLYSYGMYALPFAVRA